MTWEQIEGEQLLEPGLTAKDFKKAVQSARPTVSQEDLIRSKEWTAEFGMEG